MFSNNVFKIAFLISALTHGVMLFANPGLPFLAAHRKGQNVKVSYIKAPKEALEPKKMSAPRKGLSSKSISSKIHSPNLPSPPQFITPPKQIAFSKPAFIKPDIISVRKVITLPPVDTDKISNPSYINYYQIVREKIRRAAYQNYSRTEKGEVYLSFIVSQGGLLKEMRLVQEKSSPNPYLRETSLKSIKDASPFPAFPKDLDYPQLSFNVIISFQIE